MSGLTPMPPIRPGQMPAFRDRVLKWLRSPDAHTSWHHFEANDMWLAGADDGRAIDGILPVTDRGGPSQDQGGITRAQRADHLLQIETSAWIAGELYVVTPTMADLAMSAAKTLPYFELQRSDLPSDAGVIHFQKPIDTAATVNHRVAAQYGACTWRLVPIPPRGGVWISFWADQAISCNKMVERGEMDPRQAAAIMAQRPGLCYEDETVLRLGDGSHSEVNAYDGRGGVARGVATLLATWLLMQQQIASTRQERASAKEAKRARRKAVELKPVTVVDLRRKAADHDTQVPTQRDYSHRWMVRGHWRNQWYPSRQGHLPVWIPAHIKGPEDKPLHIPEKVQVWRR